MSRESITPLEPERTVRNARPPRATGGIPARLRKTARRLGLAVAGVALAGQLAGMPLIAPAEAGLFGELRYWWCIDGCNQQVDACRARLGMGSLTCAVQYQNCTIR